jgi:large subunit ribosomal protein L4
MMLGALRSALTAKLRDGELAIISSFTFSDHKSKTVRTTLNKLEATKKVLIVDNEDNRNLELGARNLEGVKLMHSREMSVYDLLGARKILLSRSAAQRLSETLGPKPSAHPSTEEAA